MTKQAAWTKQAFSSSGFGGFGNSPTSSTGGFAQGNFGGQPALKAMPASSGVFGTQSAPRKMASVSSSAFGGFGKLFAIAWQPRDFVSSLAASAFVLVASAFFHRMSTSGGQLDR